MKSRLFILLFLLHSFLAFTQPTFAFGMDIGVHKSAITEQSFIDYPGVSVPMGLAWGPVQGKMNYGVGTQLGVMIFKRMYLETGVGWNQIGYKETFEDLRNANRKGHKSSDHRYIDIPLSLRYELSPGKFSFYGHVGASALYYLNTKTTWQRVPMVANVGQDVYLERNRWRIAIHVGIGLNYTISPAFQLFAQHTIQYLPDIEFRPVFEHQLKTFGVEVGCRKIIKSVD
ncbi:MAG: outer membrane beta-barrel protein [Saprospiraceae bacterium]|nr:outer membrane beta-barrel protein [Saprospiraceae bacterium]